MDANSFYLLFIPGFTILAFLIGSVLATIAMSDNSESVADDESSGTGTAH